MLEELFDEDVLLHGTNTMEESVRGWEALYDYVKYIHQAFPDIMFYVAVRTNNNAGTRTPC